MEDELKGWHSRGYLPHFDGDEVIQFITIRLFDSLPAKLLESWRTDLKSFEKAEAETEFRKRVERYLDQGYGTCCLQKTEIAEIVKDALFHHDGERYGLISWVVMPNHVHFLIKVFPGKSLSVTMKSLKSYTARKANEFLKRSGSFWQKDYFDRYIRDEKHYFATIRYVEMNPVKAGLCKEPKDWKFSSAYCEDRYYL